MVDIIATASQANPSSSLVHRPNRRIPAYAAALYDRRPASRRRPVKRRTAHCSWWTSQQAREATESHRDVGRAALPHKLIWTLSGLSWKSPSGTSSFAGSQRHSISMAGGWKQTRSALVEGIGRDNAKPVNTYFVNLYETLAQSHGPGGRRTLRSRKPRTHGPGRTGTARMARMAFPLGGRGP